MKIAINKRKILVYVLCGLIITITLLFTRGAFNASSSKDALRLICDAFFLPGAILILTGALIWSLDNGVADGITYSFKKIFDLRKRAYEENEKETYSEYKERKHKNKGTVIEFFVSGCCYVVVSVVLLIVYNTL